MLKQLKTTRSAQINVLHVEVYDNPPEIRENGISVARLSPILAEWGLPTEPWTFVIDADGIVRAKYEGFVSSEELEKAIGSTLGRLMTAIADMLKIQCPPISSVRRPTTIDGICDILHILWHSQPQSPSQLQVPFAE